ncbi:MAG: cytochrome c [Thermoleophilia bacterium]
METRRLIAIVIALGALTLGILTACGGGTDAAGTLGGEVTIGTGTNPTSTPIVTSDVDPAATTAAASTGATTAAAAEGDAAAGAAVYSSAGCGGCHTLAAAGSAGNVGPNLDQLKPDYAAVMKQVTNGGNGMPAFSGTLSAADIQNVSAYVSQNAGK